MLRSVAKNSNYVNRIWIIHWKSFKSFDYDIDQWTNQMDFSKTLYFFIKPNGNSIYVELIIETNISKVSHLGLLIKVSDLSGQILTLIVDNRIGARVTSPEPEKASYSWK